MPRIRLRRPLPYWLLAASLALVTALVVSGLAGRAGAAADRWGDLRAVVVATADIAVGQTIGAGDVTVERRPAALLPADALTDPPVGRVATAATAAREAVTASRVAPGGLSRVAALLPPGMLGVAVPLDRSPLALTAGDVVDVLATFDPALAADGESHGEPTFAVAQAAVVVDVGDDAVTVAVDEREAPRVAFALAHGLVTLALRR